MERFLVILDSGVGEYSLCEVAGNTIKDAVARWSKVADLEELGLNEDCRDSLVEEVSSERYPTELQGIQNAWCGGFVLETDWLVNYFELIGTCDSTKEIASNGKLRFSFLVGFKGGTYISQFEGPSLNECSDLWKSEANFHAMKFEGKDITLLQTNLAGSEAFSKVENFESVYVLRHPMKEPSLTIWAIQQNT